jgi:hypothetical protein
MREKEGGRERKREKRKSMGEREKFFNFSKFTRFLIQKTPRFF